MSEALQHLRKQVSKAKTAQEMMDCITEALSQLDDMETTIRVLKSEVGDFERALAFYTSCQHAVPACQCTMRARHIMFGRMPGQKRED